MSASLLTISDQSTMAPWPLWVWVLAAAIAALLALGALCSWWLDRDPVDYGAGAVTTITPHPCGRHGHRYVLTDDETAYLCLHCREVVDRGAQLAEETEDYLRHFRGGAA